VTGATRLTAFSIYLCTNMRTGESMALVEDMALDMHVGQGSERAKVLLDSNTRKHSCILEVALVNGVFRAFTLNS
jgi:hypothetical protein